MMKEINQTRWFRVNWCDELKFGRKSILWEHFRPVTDTELGELESTIARKLPEDYLEFMRKIGCGSISRGGDIYSPEQVNHSVGVPIYFTAGSMMHGKEWATAAEHREFWLSGGKKNPNPEMFTNEVLRFHDMSLLNLLQIGSDGSAGYQMLNLDEASSTKYLLITGGTNILFAGESFRVGISWLTDWLLGTAE